VNAGASGIVAGIVAAAEAFLSCVSDFDAAGLAPAECVVVTEVASRVEKASGALRMLAGAKAAAGAYREAGAPDASSWLARQGGTTGRDAKAALELARSLDTHPRTKQALLDGSVSVAQAKEITKADAEMPGSEEELLEIARQGDLTELRDHARERRLGSVPVDQLHARQVDARRFRHWRDGLGMVCFEGALPPETGIPFVSRIEREAARRYRASKRTSEVDRFEAHAADALYALTMTGSDGTRPSATDLVIVCDINAWRRGHAHPAEPCHIVGGGPIPVELAKQLSQDAFLKVVLHDGVDIHKVHHHGRRYTAELRTALDLGAVPAFDGRACSRCTRRWSLQYDHKDPIAHAGTTSYANVQSLCYSCHAQKTEEDRRAGLLGNRAAARGSAPPTGTQGKGPRPRTIRGAPSTPAPP
jgi:hypothetical protein